ncbi:MAG: NPCBM/NEW2 domain-containing protein [Candidatus Hydrogenedentota bacterium]
MWKHTYLDIAGLPAADFPHGIAVALLLICAWGASAAGLPTNLEHMLQSDHPPSSAVWLDSLDLSPIRQDWGRPRAGRSVGRNEMRVGGIRYPHGLGTHAFSECHIELYENCERFLAMAGIDDEVGPNGSVIFEVWVDDALRWKSPVLKGNDAPHLVEVDLASASRLTLIVDPAGDGIHLDHADWAGALLFLRDKTSQYPRVVSPPPVDPPSVSDSQPDAPKINAPRVVGCTPGNPFLFRIPCAGQQPISIAAKGLPPGLTLDADTGIIRGVVQEKDVYTLDIHAQNIHGEGRQTILLVAVPHSLALTPPLGWNSWNVWGETVDAAKVRAAADALIATRLADYGFQYVCIDDGWARGRDSDGAIRPNQKFPDMPRLVRYVHHLGLKAGIYSSPGRTTCAGYEGSYDHEFQDARTFSSWGMDFLKYDWCSYNAVAQGQGREMFMKPYRLMRQALDACDRDIVYAICQYGIGNVWEWAAEPDVRGNLWRTTKDITDTWPSMLHNARATAEVTGFARPGHWNHADIMVLGKLGWGKELRDTRLNPREQHTHVTLWTLLPSPMFLGCDLKQLDAFTLNLLRNPEIIAVHQDPAAQPLRSLARDEKKQTRVWARKLWDGTFAVGLFNFGRRKGPQQIAVTWTQLGLPSAPQPVRDLWRRKNLESTKEGITLTIPPHGCALLKMGVPMKDDAALEALRHRYEAVQQK